MKLVALNEIHGVKVLKRVKKTDESEFKDIACHGDLYEGKESHIRLGIARKPEGDTADDTADDTTDNTGAGEADKLKQRCVELGIEESKWKRLQKPEKILAVIEEFEKNQAGGEGEGEGEGDDKDLGLD